MPSLSIVIPALNEEASIASIIERCLAVRLDLKKEANLDDVEIIVVSDGSTDRTPEIAASYKDIKLIAYEKNKGYGAALKIGFASSKGTIVSFLDADGTCDPRSFIPMCKLMIAENADVVLGSRMHKDSKMPLVRRIGNYLYAILISIIGNTIITDSASGMRVIQRSSLSKLYPLPNGLHFTPAMSCKAVLDPELKILEITMPYQEREGRSKLSVIKDGFRFLNVILDISLSYRPRKIIGSIGLVLLLVSVIYAFYPIEFYLSYHRLEEWMIYRLVTVMVLAVGGLNIISISEACEQMLQQAGYRKSSNSLIAFLLNKVFSQKALLFFGIGIILLGILVNTNTIIQYVTTRTISVHWSYVIFGATTVLAGLQLVGLGLLLRFISFFITRIQPETESIPVFPVVSEKVGSHVQ